MISWKYYKFHQANILGKRNKYDSNIYTFDIETTSYIILDGRQYLPIDYLSFSKHEQEVCLFRGCMYLWTFGINKDIYYGRTWDELKMFLDILDKNIPYKKYVYVHNLSFEFQFIRSVFKMDTVFARNVRHVMYATLLDYNIEFRCTYLMTNARLEFLPKVYNLDVKKLVGNLDYGKIRHPDTILTSKELEYAEADCLVVYKYILHQISLYNKLRSIPRTLTGQVRNEFRDLTIKDYRYRRITKRSINIDPHVYNLLEEAFMGGYTHASYIYTDNIIKNVDSYDFTSSYPYVMISNKYPMTTFSKVDITDVSEMSKSYAYIIVVEFRNVESKYYNTFISLSKCRNVRGGVYDNGRVLKAKSLEMTLTDVDFRFILTSYKCEYTILESYQALYGYLPRKFIKFILEKYVNKTKYKGDKDHIVEYQLEKNKFNSLYGMSVTNTIRDNVIYDNDRGWYETPLSNDEIIEALTKEKKKSFLSFSWGVWVTAHARNNLLRLLTQLDEYVIYADTDSLKLSPGYSNTIITKYNENVKSKIDYLSTLFHINKENYSPKDIFGNAQMIGLFSKEPSYEEFITQGAKKYAYIQNGEIGITVSGVPKSAKVSLKTLEDFKDNLVFEYKDTNKHIISYADSQEPYVLTDYNGIKYKVTDKTSAVLIPTTYKLGKSLEYSYLLNATSSKRAIFKERREDYERRS